jgi:uncharacterized protein with PIN domain
VLYNWEIDTLVESVDLEPQDLNELIISLENDMQFIMESVIKRFKDRLWEIVADKDLCPKCFTTLVYGDEVKELMGYVGDAPAYQKIPTKMVCPECDYYEEV